MMAPLTLALALLMWPAVQAVDHSKFKSCSQSGFCRRLRGLADSAPTTSPYSAIPLTQQDAPGVAFEVASAAYEGVRFALSLRVMQNGAARITMDEVDGLRQRYNETASWVLQSGNEADIDPSRLEVRHSGGETTVQWDVDGKKAAVVRHAPLRIAFLRDGVEHVVLNDRNLLHMEHFRLKQIGNPESREGDTEDGDTEAVGSQSTEQVVLSNTPAFEAFKSEDGGWEESYGGKTDSKPKGPEALSIDIDFPNYSHVYGLPEHASPLSLKTTRGGDGAYDEPYRLYNLDVFEYEADSPMALYGSVPFLQAHRKNSTVGVLLLAGSETWVDVVRRSQGSSALFSSPSLSTSTHWMAESGILDLVIFLGPEQPVSTYTSLTGRPPLPQYFAIGYHQCRWNYQSEKDVLDVQAKFDEADIPLDVMWLDIEYAHEHEYFIWDRRYFPTPENMQASLADKGRKLVAIVDPHIKRDPGLYIYTEAQALDILSKTPDGQEFEGWCWTGSSAWTDWFNPKSWNWWIGQFTFEKFKGSTKHLFVWNDMNEPSIFNGPEITMQKDAIHFGGWEHRDVHNIGGMIYQNLTGQGLIAREDPARRPFVLTRAFFAGSQRFGAHWTGDNLGTWSHLAGAVPMFLTSGASGLPFVGADVGGFFGNPSHEMMVRWYQLGSVMPFFRAHGHIDTKRREPYLYPEPIRSYLRHAVRFRYTLLPAFYTAFHEAARTGLPILRPQFLMFPDDDKGFAIDDQFYLGSSGLLVKPVVTEGSLSVDVHIADQEPYYHYDRHDIFFGAQSGSATVAVPASLDSLPILLQGGQIFPRRDLVRRASTLMWKDPVTLLIGVDRLGSNARGSLYMDDGDSFAFEKGDYIHRSFVMSPASHGKAGLTLTSRSFDPTIDGVHDPENNAWAKKISDVKVSQIVILGLAQPPSCIRTRSTGATGLEFNWFAGVASSASRRHGGHDKKASRLVVTSADLSIVKDWELHIEVGGVKCSVAPARANPLVALESPECPAGHFQCLNKGHEPSCILVSRVNDGICDPECCDGSDETDGKAICPNQCVKVGAEQRKKAEEEGRKRRVGAAIRKDYSTHGFKEKRKLETAVENGQREIAELRAKEISAKSRLEQYEAEEAGEIERKKNSVLYERIVEMQEAIKALKTHRTNLEAHVSELSGILADLSRDFNPNYQDMAVLGASRAYTDWKKANGLEESAAEETSSEAPGEPANSASATPHDGSAVDISDAQLDQLTSEDPLSLIDMLSTRVGTPTGVSKFAIFRVEDYLPESWKPSFVSMKGALLDILVKTGIIITPSTPGDADRPEIALARSLHSTAVDDIAKAESRLEENRQALQKDWGRDWEWKKLDQTCIENNTGEYTYILCFFGESFQKSNSNGMKTSLGHFSSWASGAEPGSDEHYSKHVYDNGQRCWNGPARSAKVDFTCGTSNALVSVVEPEKCEYLFQVTTPAVCYPLDAADASSTKSEL